MSLNLCNFCTARYYNPAPPPHSYRIRNRGSERVNNLPTATQPERGRTGKTNHVWSARWGCNTLCFSTTHPEVQGLKKWSQLHSPRLLPQTQAGLRSGLRCSFSSLPCVFATVFRARKSRGSPIYLIYSTTQKMPPRLLEQAAGPRHRQKD